MRNGLHRTELRNRKRTEIMDEWMRQKNSPTDGAYRRNKGSGNRSLEQGKKKQGTGKKREWGRVWRQEIFMEKTAKETTGRASILDYH